MSHNPYESLDDPEPVEEGAADTPYANGPYPDFTVTDPPASPASATPTGPVTSPSPQPIGYSPAYGQDHYPTDRYAQEPTQAPPAYGAPGSQYPAQYGAPGYGVAPTPTSGYGPGYGAPATPQHVGYGRPFVNDPFGPDAPLPGANPVQAFLRFWKRGLRFSGRASRSEYWWMVLINFAIVYGSTLVAMSPTFGNAYADPMAGVSMFASLYLLASLVPSLAVTVRRLHDSNTSGFMALTALIPAVGFFVLLVFALMGSRPEGARFDAINSR